MALRATKAAARVPSRPSVGQWGAREAGILDVARALYVAHGYERVSMADVAAAAGLSEGTLYNYFRDQNDLVVSVGLAALEKNIAAAERIAEGATSLRVGLEGLIAHQLQCMLAAPEMYRIWLREVKAAEGYGKSDARAQLRGFSSHFLAFLDRWVPGSPVDRGMMRDMFYGGIEQIGWTAIVQNRKPRLDIDAAAAMLADAFMAAFGLEQRPSPASKIRSNPRKNSSPPH